MKLIATFMLCLCSVLAAAQTGGKFESVQDALSHADEVTELQLSGITDPLPANISKLKNLTVVRLINLDASYDLGNAFEKLAELRGVEEIHLYGNEHEHLPRQIVELPNLRFVCLSTAMKPNLDEALDLLVKINSLAELSLRGFELTQLPEKIAALQNLRSLDLGSNPNLDYEQAFAVLGRLEHLTTLNLDFNEFDRFPAAIVKLTQLETLEMSMLRSKFNVAETYRILAQLPNLRHLNVSGNFLGSFPPEIQQLRQLKTLNIEGNAIGEEDMHALQELLPNTLIINKTPF